MIRFQIDKFNILLTPSDEKDLNKSHPSGAGNIKTINLELF